MARRKTRAAKRQIPDRYTELDDEVYPCVFHTHADTLGTTNHVSYTCPLPWDRIYSVQSSSESKLSPIQSSDSAKVASFLEHQHLYTTTTPTTTSSAVVVEASGGAHVAGGGPRVELQVRAGPWGRFVLRHVGARSARHTAHNGRSVGGWLHVLTRARARVGAWMCGCLGAHGSALTQAAA